jgi:lipopolysaccharide/colanic/teichoic acid biosynthesis glycosyltransferase
MLNNMLRFKANARLESQLSLRRDRSLGPGMLPADLFRRLLWVERKRTERSGRRFVLMLLDTGSLLKAAKGRVMPNLLAAISQATRDTDLKGWYRDDSIVGVIFTEVGNAEDKSVVHSLSSKLTDALYGELSISDINEMRQSFHIFPKDWDSDRTEDPVTATLLTELAEEINRTKTSLLVKRLIDIVGSVVGLTLCLPVMVLIGLGVKLTSSGPVIFRQVRLGQYGRKFMFLKFRSMYVDRDHKLHEDYVRQFIMGIPGAEQSTGNQQKLYKLTADPRITPLGRFLRNTSLDELPQFLNVLLGDMSLVGPRPPVTYEFDRYDLWHKQRLLAVKPGITGLWQVDGRSMVKFDEMVRLDIRYARSWSLWLDLKILFQTPRAVLTGSGAC